MGDPLSFAQGAGFSDARKRAERAMRQQLIDSRAATPDTALDSPVQADDVATTTAQLHSRKAASPTCMCQASC